MNETILKAYKLYNYPSASKLYKILNGEYKLKDIVAALDTSKVRQLYYKKVKKGNGHILATSPNESWQSDLLFMNKFGSTNNGYKYILLNIDVFSRFIFAVPIKSKHGNEVAEAFGDLKYKPNILMTDNGTEFKGNKFQSLCLEEDIIHRMAIVGNHNALGIIDRATLTIKNAIYKSFIANNDTKWYDKIQNIIKAYNNSPHRGIENYTPYQAMTDDIIIGLLTVRNLELMKKQSPPPIFTVGDSVRTRIKTDKFTRGYVQKWSSNISKVEKVVGNIIYINGKKFKITNVQKVNADTEPVGDELKKALKKDKVKRVLNVEGVKVENIAKEPRKREKENYIGRIIKKKYGKKYYTAKVTEYEPPSDGDEASWIVEYTGDVPKSKNIIEGKFERILSINELKSSLQK